MITPLLGAILMVPVLLNAALFFPRQMRPLSSYLEFAVPETILIVIVVAVGLAVGKLVERKRLFIWILVLCVLTALLISAAKSLCSVMDTVGMTLAGAGLYSLAFWVASRKKISWVRLVALFIGLASLASLSFYVGLGVISIPLIFLALALTVVCLKPQLPDLPKSLEAFSIIVGPAIVAIMAYLGLLPFAYLLAMMPAALELYLLQLGKRGILVSTGLSVLFFVILEILGSYA